MQTNPFEERQQLAALYGEMGDIEIRELAAAMGDLTETAQEVLREELKKRGLPETTPPFRSASAVSDPDNHQWESDRDLSEGHTEEEDGSPEYTWKTPLSECNTSKEAWQLVLSLRQAGVDAWVEKPQSGGSYPRVVVAADQLELARVIAAQPIPQDIVDEMNEEVPVYKPPTCSRCGATDPTLVSATFANLWHCESCGNDWADPEENATPDQDKRMA